MALSILNLQTGHYTWGSSLADGSFELLLNGQPGSEYAIYQRCRLMAWKNYQFGVGTTVERHLLNKNEIFRLNTLFPAAFLAQ